MIARLSYFGKNANIHAVKYIADENRHIITRLFWLSVLALNIYGMFIYFYESYKAFNSSAVSFVTETAYLNWNTTFPTISICEIKGADLEYDDYEFGEHGPVDEFIHDLVYFTGDCYSCSMKCDDCDQLNFTEEVRKKRSNCSSLMKDCEWNNQKFDCCEQFHPLETEYGTCFSLNSKHTIEGEFHSKYISNRKTGPGHLHFKTTKDVRLHIHPNEDVPFINADPDMVKDILVGETTNVSVNVIEIENDENIVNIPIEKRGCRFPWERPDHLKVHKFYSYSTCVVQCRVENHFKICGCTHHHMPYYNRIVKYCDMQGLKCLTDKTATLNALHAAGFEKPGLVCDCVPSCNEPEYKIVSDSQGPHTGSSEVNIKLQALPTQRFKRIVTRTTMDLVVSFGGTAGLFIGASLLSIVEAIYLLFLRKL